MHPWPHILAAPENDYTKVIFGLIFAAIWAVGAILSAYAKRKQAQRNEEIERELEQAARTAPRWDEVATQTPPRMQRSEYPPPGFPPAPPRRPPPPPPSRQPPPPPRQTYQPAPPRQTYQPSPQKPPSPYRKPDRAQPKPPRRQPKRPPPVPAPPPPPPEPERSPEVIYGRAALPREARPADAPVIETATSAAVVRRILRQPAALRQQFVISELLRPPLAMRRDEA